MKVRRDQKERLGRRGEGFFRFALSHLPTFAPSHFPTFAPSHLRTFALRAKRATRATRATAGYALLDVIVALTVFSIWGVSLMSLLREISLQSEGNARDRLIQYQLQSFITEARHKPIEEIPAESLDENLNVRFTTTVEPLQLANFEGNNLSDLYTVKVIAQWEERGEPITETAEVYLYQPEQE